MSKAVGKRVRDALYVHRDALPSITPLLQATVMKAADFAAGAAGEWNVARLRSGSVALLTYLAFNDDPFPALASSVLIDVGSGTARRTISTLRKNPAILHRKELLLATDDPRR